MPRLMPARAAAGAPPMSRLEEFAVLAVGVAVLVILTSLPVIGPLVEIVVVLLGLGAIGLVTWGAWRRPSASGAVSGTVPATPGWGAPSPS
jgi:hypothetical protein